MVSSTATAEAPSPSERLRHLLVAAKTPSGDARKAILAALHDPDFERSLLLKTRSADERMGSLGALAKAAAEANINPRDRDEIIGEWERLALRIVKSERLIERICDSSGGPAEKAAGLMALLRHRPPLGRELMPVLERVHDYLDNDQAKATLATAPALRKKLQILLEESGLEAEVLKIGKRKAKERRV